MHPLLILLVLMVCGNALHAQVKNPIGTFSNGVFPFKEVSFFTDSTFQYTSSMHPQFFTDSKFSEKGKWTVIGDTIVLNPNLTIKPAIESDFTEEISKDTMTMVTFNHIKRHYDQDNNLVSSDTVQIWQLDFAFNEWNRKNLRRVSEHRSVRCTFAGFIPKETITTERSIYVNNPGEPLKSLYVGCYELQGTKEFPIRNPHSNRFTVNVYSNYYDDGQIRQMKLLMKNSDVLYTNQKSNGKFAKDNIWDGNRDGRLTRRRS